MAKIQKIGWKYRFGRIIIWHNRGGVVFGFIMEMIQNFAIAGLAIEIANKLVASIFNSTSVLQIPLWIIPILVIVKPIIQVFIGKWDTEKGTYQAEKEYYTATINPFFRRQEKRDKRVEEKIDKILKENDESRNNNTTN